MLIPKMLGICNLFFCMVSSPRHHDFNFILIFLLYFCNNDHLPLQVERTELMKKKLIPLLLLLPLQFLLAMYGRDSQKEQSRVVIIAIDGLRWQEVFEGAKRDSLMPFLWEMGNKEGCLIGNRHKKSKMEVANGIWKSYAGYSEMLCGVADDEHIFDNRKKLNPNRSVLELADACSEYKNKVAAVASWDVVPYILNYRRSQLPIDYKSRHMVSAQVRCDSVTLNRALKTLGEKHPKLLFVEFCETDFYGHHGKWNEYLNAAHQNDAFIRKLWQYCQNDEFYKGNTTFIITCDHGRGESLGIHVNRGEVDSAASWTEHGKHIAGSNQTWLVAFGNHIQHLGEVEGGKTIYTKQIAPTIASILNVPFTNSNEQVATPIYKILKQAN